VDTVIELLEEAEEAVIDSKELIDDNTMLAMIKKISELAEAIRLCTNGRSDSMEEALNQITAAYPTAIKLKVVS